MKKCLSFFVIFFLLLNGCSTVNEAYTEKTIYAMDTVMSLKAYGKNAAQTLDQSADKIAELDTEFRRDNPESEIYKLNNHIPCELSNDTVSVIESALNISKSTNGDFDLTITPIMDLWGFYTKNFYVPSEEEIAYTLQKVDYTNIVIDNKSISVSDNSTIDLGGIAKGYTSSVIADIFKKNNVESGIISLGGNVQAIGSKPNGKPWKVGIQNPDNNDNIGYVSIVDKSVITSGSYQRYFEQNNVIYHHIIDPKTGSPSSSDLKSVSVISGDATIADGLSTAFFVMGIDKTCEYLKSHDNIDVIFITNDNKIYITDGLNGVFDSEYDYSIINI